MITRSVWTHIQRLKWLKIIFEHLFGSDPHHSVGCTSTHVSRFGYAFQICRFFFNEAPQLEGEKRNKNIQETCHQAWIDMDRL